ncbi:MAG: hypothetical protein QOE54_3225 [Streptosporangiaceae bacterium]|nr:hypothetical protein [Streptosporangiaceae bacterium]
MTTIQTTRFISVDDLRAELTDGAEIALVDIREGDAYAGGHISVAVPIPDSELELQITARVPRLGVRLVVTDDDGAAAEAAAARLAALGYHDVRALDGGVQAWVAAGNELITGLNSLSKALGEFVERRYHTPRITVEQLKQKLDAGEDLVVLDTRPLPEYRHIAIPGGRPAPGAELLYRVFDQISSERTQVVVNCAGRTRAIIGAQALINAGVTNPVVSLENGTSAWLFAGYGPVQGAADLIDAPSPEALKRVTEAAARIRRRFGVIEQGRDEVEKLRAEGEERTLYLFDIRTPDEYLQGHLPGAVSAPGGQLVQATDLYIGTRNARVTLVDTPDLVRSSITASWLLQLGLDEVYVHTARPQDLTERDTGPAVDSTAGPAVAALTAADLSAKLAAGETVTVIDLQPPAAYFETRRFIPGSVVARRSTLLGDPGLLAGALQRGPVVLVSSDSRLSRLAASELTNLSGEPVWALDGGMDAWSAAGNPTETGTAQPPLTPGDALPPQPDLEARKVAFAEYVAWGDRITEQLERDGLVCFRGFEGAADDV